MIRGGDEGGRLRVGASQLWTRGFPTVAAGSPLRGWSATSPTMGEKNKHPIWVLSVKVYSRVDTAWVLIYIYMCVCIHPSHVYSVGARG